MDYIGQGYDHSGKKGPFIVIKLDAEAVSQLEVDEKGKISFFVFPQGDFSHTNVQKEEDWHSDYSVAVAEPAQATEKKPYTKAPAKEPAAKSTGFTQPRKFKPTAKKSAFRGTKR